MSELDYCPKCGRALFKDACYPEGQRCDLCNTMMLDVPDKYFGDNPFLLTDEMEQKLFEELVIPSPEFDQALFDSRDERVARNSAAYDAMMAHGRAIAEERSRVARCPSCGSANVSQIGTFSRMVSTGLFGLASSKIGKTHKCNNCGTTW